LFEGETLMILLILVGVEGILVKIERDLIKVLICKYGESLYIYPTDFYYRSCIPSY